VWADHPHRGGKADSQKGAVKIYQENTGGKASEGSGLRIRGRIPHRVFDYMNGGLILYSQPVGGKIKRLGKG